MQYALEVFDKTQNRYGRVYLLGYSLGSSVASFVASQREVEKLFLVGAFYSMRALARERLGFDLPLLRYRFETCEYLKKAHGEVSLFCSQEDTVVPIANALKVQECPQNLKRCLVLKELDHVEILWDERVIERVREDVESEDV